MPSPGRTAPRRSPAMLVVRALTWVGAVAVLATPFFSPGSPVSLVRVAMEQPASLTITGSIEGLRAGAPASLALTLASAGDAEVVVQTVAVQVTAASPGCPTGSLRVGSWSGHLVVPALGRVTTAIPVTLHDPHGACTGATWQLSYTSA